MPRPGAPDLLFWHLLPDINKPMVSVHAPAGTAEITPENLGQTSIICKFEPDAVEFDKNLWRWKDGHHSGQGIRRIG